MKHKEYCLAKEISYRTPGGDDILFPAGTLVFPFLNETLLPDHIKKSFEKSKNDLNMPWQSKNNPGNKLVMCVIGTHWLPLRREEIRDK